MIYAAYFLLIFSLILYLYSGRRRKAAGLPGGRVIYTDTKEWGKLEVPLYDPVAKLTGRPRFPEIPSGDRLKKSSPARG